MSCFDGQVMELCVGFCKVTDLHAIVCRLISEPSSTNNAGRSPLLKSIGDWAVLSPTELVVAVECLQHIFEVTSFVREGFCVHSLLW